MAKNPNKKGRGFVIGMIVYAVLFLALTGVGLYYLWDFMDAFVLPKEDYEMFHEGFYNDDHYIIHILELPLAMAESYLISMKDKIADLIMRDHLIEQIEQWEEVGELTDAQYSAVINDKGLSERIRKKLSQDEGFFDSYWRAVSEIGGDLVRKYSQKEPNNE